jgi:hypothetical protein
MDLSASVLGDKQESRRTSSLIDCRARLELASTQLIGSLVVKGRQNDIERAASIIGSQASLAKGP